MENIIRITEKEIPVVRNLAREIWNEHYIKILSQEQINYMLDLFYSEEKICSEIKNGVIWEMLLENTMPMGFLACKPESKKIYIGKLYLKKAIRGKGFGKQLITRAVNLARLKGKKFIYLKVNKYNTDSIKFYERHNFVKVNEGVFDIGNGFVMDDYIYELSV